MGEVVSLFKHGYPHVICSSCDHDAFHIRTFEDKNGVYYFEWLICTKCGNEIPLQLSPCFTPRNIEDE